MKGLKKVIINDKVVNDGGKPVFMYESEETKAG